MARKQPKGPRERLEIRSAHAPKTTKSNLMQRFPHGQRTRRFAVTLSGSARKLLEDWKYVQRMRQGQQKETGGSAFPNGQRTRRAAVTLSGSAQKLLAATVSPRVRSRQFWPCTILANQKNKDRHTHFFGRYTTP